MKLKTQTNTGIKRQGWDFPSDPVARTLYSHAGDLGSTLVRGLGSQMLQPDPVCHTKTQHRQINK